MTIYLVNYDPNGEDIAIVIDGKPKILGSKKTETIPGDGDVTIRVSKLNNQNGLTMITVEHKATHEVQHEDQD